MAVRSLAEVVAPCSSHGDEIGLVQAVRRYSFLAPLARVALASGLPSSQDDAVKEFGKFAQSLTLNFPDAEEVLYLDLSPHCQSTSSNTVFVVSS